MKEPLLTTMLLDINVIRMSFDTAEHFPLDDPMRAEMQTLIVNARAELCLKLRVSGNFVLDDFVPRPERFKLAALNLVADGTSRQALDIWLGFELFCLVAEQEQRNGLTVIPIYAYDFNVKQESLRYMAPGDLYTHFIRDSLQSAETPENSGRKYLFDRNVFQKFAALMFALSAGDYGAGGFGDNDSTAPVPKVPLTPMRVAAEANPRPEPVDREPEYR